jgi:hypothetical protein
MPAESTAGGGPHGSVTDDTRRRTLAKKRGARPPVERIERRAVSALVPYAQNPRLHSDEQVDQIAASMKEFGQAQLVVVDEKGEIIAGHGRVLAAQRLKWKELQVAIAVGWNDAQKRAYRIADNQIALTSRWDQDLLRSELKMIEGGDLDLGLIGFDEGYLAGLLADMGTNGDVMAEWAGMPEFEHGDKSAFRSIVVHFKDAAAVEQFEKLIGRKLTNRFMWYPEIEIDVAHAKRYESSK